MVLLVLAATCAREQVDVVVSEESSDFGRGELIASVDRFSTNSQSAAAFAQLRAEVAATRPRFNRRVADEAERKLVFLALGPLRAHAKLPAAEQMEALATTVWPLSLGVEPEDKEAAADYVRRVCEANMVADCRFVVPEYWPDVLSAAVWKDLAARARRALLLCYLCQREPDFAQALTEFEHQEVRASQRLHIAEEDGHPDRWPFSGEASLDWSGAPVLRFKNAHEIILDGDPVSEAGRAVALAELASRSKLLGLHMNPDRKVRDLVDLLGELKRAGFDEVALVARPRDFPYPRREYRVAVGDSRLLNRLGIRESDSIQLLVHALDVAARNR